MTNIIAFFPNQEDATNSKIIERNQVVLDGEHTDLSTVPMEESSLQKTPKEIAREDVERVKQGKIAKGELRAKYSLTASSHRNMKDRDKRGKCKVHPEFELFHSFLWHMGPRPSKNYTLDRIDNDNPLCGPRLCRWLDKAGQANNRSSTIYITDKHGECLPLTVWAMRTGQKPDTMRRRRKAGWSDPEIIKGERVAQPNVNYRKFEFDPVPWRGDDDLVLLLEKRYLIDSRENIKRFPNRYVWYERQIHKQLDTLEHRLGRCTGDIDDIILPPEDVPSIDAFEAQLEPRGDEKRIKEISSKLHRIEKLLGSIQDEHAEWRAVQSQRDYSAEERKLLRGIRAKQRKSKR